MCPACDYLLQGSVGQSSCPECGFVLDADTFELTGVSRGMSDTSWGRRILWAVIIISLVLWTQSCQLLLQVGVFRGDMEMVVLAVYLLVGVALAVAVIAMVRTGRGRGRAQANAGGPAGGDESPVGAVPAQRSRGSSAVEHFIFAAEGFAGLGRIDPLLPYAGLTPWGEVDHAELHRIGPTWYRLRLGRRRATDQPDQPTDRPVKFDRVLFEAGVRCRDEDAPALREAFARRLGHPPAREHPPTPE